MTQPDDKPQWPIQGGEARVLRPHPAPRILADGRIFRITRWCENTWRWDRFPDGRYRHWRTRAGVERYLKEHP